MRENQNGNDGYMLANIYRQNSIYLFFLYIPVPGRMMGDGQIKRWVMCWQKKMIRIKSMLVHINIYKKQ